MTSKDPPTTTASSLGISVDLSLAPPLQTGADLDRGRAQALRIFLQGTFLKRKTVGHARGASVKLAVVAPVSVQCRADQIPLLIDDGSTDTDGPQIKPTLVNFSTLARDFSLVYPAALTRISADRRPPYPFPLADNEGRLIMAKVNSWDYEQGKVVIQPVRSNSVQEVTLRVVLRRLMIDRIDPLDWDAEKIPSAPPGRPPPAGPRGPTDTAAQATSTRTSTEPISTVNLLDEPRGTPAPFIRLLLTGVTGFEAVEDWSKIDLAPLALALTKLRTSFAPPKPTQSLTDVEITTWLASCEALMQLAWSDELIRKVCHPVYLGHAWGAVGASGVRMQLLGPP